ncbi:MAG: TetR/AcrR family transcriptional regulator [Nannocystaceae bacterium]
MSTGEDDGAGSDGGAEGGPEGGPEGGDGRSVRAQLRREQRRGEILAAATRVFSEKGYHAASVHDIIDAAEIARGTFYLYFNGKREIFTELTTEFLAVIRGSVRRISLDPEAPEPIEQMRANFQRVMGAVIAHEDLATVMLREGGDLDAEARALMDQFFAQVVGLIELAVRVGRTLGFARDCDDRIVAVSALGALREVLNRMLAARRAARLRAADLGSPRTETGPGAGQGAAGSAGSSAAPSANSSADAPGDPDAALTEPERLADELVTFFVRGVFT